ncbi:hypothetical protein AM500_21525 [Bacillus sp. FJAT-18017]|uniref:hypothetical protein n=1 Tax=Bacillus sp. FJAT-18017 TaxID=1705566 RepID=UPI0006ADE328|nr:hypothetical protein [Bacillus sp. FJAT-18017]ALC92083.1 hypothetical protein AM500_21525 [Bacillus sp. FJAT-18017]
MEKKLADFRADHKRGRFNKDDILWLIDKVDELHAENRKLRHSKGLRPYLSLAEQNLSQAQYILGLEARLDQLEEQLAQRHPVNV